MSTRRRNQRGAELPTPAEDTAQGGEGTPWSESSQPNPGGVVDDSGTLGDRVARRAFERWQQRGGEHGRDLDDWLEAERELAGRQGEEEESS